MNVMLVICSIVVIIYLLVDILCLPPYLSFLFCMLPTKPSIISKDDLHPIQRDIWCPLNINKVKKRDEKVMKRWFGVKQM